MQSNHYVSRREFSKIEQLIYPHISDPFDAFLFLRGLKTLKLRVDCQQKSAQAVAEFLATHPQVTSVNYPGLATSPGYLLQRKQARGAGVR